jgi:hypothetical protein
MAGEVMLINPRRRRRKKATTTRRKRRVRRHNPTVYRKRRVIHRRRRHNPVRARRRRRHVRHNPAMKMLGLPVMQIVGFTGGFIVTEVLADKLAAMLPATWKTNADVLRIGSKAAIGVGLPMVLKMTKLVPHNIANAIAVGGGICVLWDVFKTYIGPKIGLTLSAYEQLSEYRMLPSAAGIAGMDEAYGDTAYV